MRISCSPDLMKETAPVIRIIALFKSPTYYSPPPTNLGVTVVAACVTQASISAFVVLSSISCVGSFLLF